MTAEVLAGHAATYRMAWRPVDVAELHRGWEHDLTTGRRRVDKARQHGRTAAQSSANAKPGRGLDAAYDEWEAKFAAAIGAGPRGIEMQIEMAGAILGEAHLRRRTAQRLGPNRSASPAAILAELKGRRKLGRCLA
jgi:hypothetical protein